jgi:hypothetical protein
MKFGFARLCGAVFGALLSSAASANVVTFSELTSPSDTFFGPVYQSGGLTFTSSNNETDSLGS